MLTAGESASSAFQRRQRRRWIAVASGLASALVLGALACSGTTSSGIEPTTGILIRAEALTTGRGCGRDPTNLFKYAVVVFGGPANAPRSEQVPVTFNVFDCFTDGAFIQLEPVAGSTTYRLEVYAYNEPAYAAAQAKIHGPDMNVATATAILRATSPTWTTECSATQQRDVETLALCNPLTGGLTGIGEAAGPTRISLGTASFRLPDGRVATCTPAPAPDAGSPADASPADAASSDADAGVSTDAGADARVDASKADADAGPVDASPTDADATATDAQTDAQAEGGAPLTFTTVRIRHRIGGSFVGPTSEVTCPATYVAEVPAEPALYAVDVGLVGGSGAPVGETSCSVMTQTGATSSAVCP